MTPLAFEREEVLEQLRPNARVRDAMTYMLGSGDSDHVIIGTRLKSQFFIDSLYDSGFLVTQILFVYIVQMLYQVGI